MKVVIMAGGKGTRISSVASDIPKPMIKIEGKPVLEHEIECLRDQGFKDIILTVSHLGNIIMDYFGDGSGISPVTGKSFGVNIEYYFEKEPLGNAGALFKIKDKLTEDFLLLNADAMFDVDFNRFVEFHKSHGGLVTLFTHPNSHPYDSGLIIANENGIVQKWLAKEDERPLYYKNRVNAGLHVMSPEILKQNIDTPKIDLDRQLLKPLSGTGKMFCYDSPEYVKDMGTPDRYYAVCEDFKAGHVQGKNLKNKQKAIFLDRDACAIVLVGHMNKTNGGKNIYRGLGSIDIAAAARSVLLVARDKDEPLDIKQIEMSVKGLSRARNRGLEQASGEIVVLSDDDCWYPTNAFEIIVNAFEKRQSAIIVLSQIFDPEKNISYKNYTSNEEYVRNKLQLMSKSSIEVAFKKDLVMNKKFDERLGLGGEFVCGEEVDFLLSNYEKNAIFYIPEVTVYHKKKENGSSNKQIIAKGAVYALF